MRWEVLVFDWDGTLVDSEAHIVSCIAEASSVVGLPELSYDRMKSIIGLGMREALEALYPGIADEQIEALRQHYSERFRASSESAMKLFDGVEDVLESLKSQGFRLAVATGKSRRGLEVAKRQTGLGRFFDIECCADETSSKPDPRMLHKIAGHYDVSPGRMLMVGDTTFDLEMASRAGSDSVAVSYGVHAVSELSAWNPKTIIDEMSELPAWLRQLD